jgi:hypothetical protein
MHVSRFGLLLMFVALAAGGFEIYLGSRAAVEVTPVDLVVMAVEWYVIGWVISAVFARVTKRAS